MKKTSTQFSVLFIFLLLLFNFQLSAQLPGFINRPATIAGGRAVLDPNGDGYTSLTTAGFGNNDVTNSELSYKGIKAYSIEPFGDLRRGPNHNYSDFVPDSSGNGVYHYFSPAQNVLFRMRMGSIMPGSKGYSIMMDTDGKFGATGPNADPNYLPSTTGTNGNPGFEIEVVLETNFRIAIYNVDGTSSPVLVKQYLNWQDMSQVSIASSNDNGDPDFLMDFYIPFSDLQAAPFNLTTSSSIRMAATTVMAPKAATGGPRSDLYGTSGDTYEDFINGQPVCQVFVNPATCPTAMCTAPPTVNSPINTGTVTISGTWTKSTLTGAASTANITVYKNVSTVVGTINNVTSGSTWTLNNITLNNGEIITAKAVGTGETMCLTSNAVAASTCNSSTIPATPILICTSGSKGLGGTNLSTGWTVHVDNMTRNEFNNSITNNPVLFGANTGTSPNINWMYSGGCSSGAPLNSGTYKVYYSNTITGCTSMPAYFCAAGNGGTALAGSLTVPVLTSPVNSVFTTATTSISGTTDANASLALYINGINVQNSTASAGGVFNFTGLTLLNGQTLYIVAELNTGSVSTSKCSNQTGIFTVSCYTQPPLINGDNNNQLKAGSPITGTSIDPPGTTINVYTSTNTLLATTTVQANGTWTTSPATASAGITYYANAQNGSCGVSANSASYSTVVGTSAGRCGTITGPITPDVTSISGTLTGSFSTTTVNLYLDDELIGSAVTSGTSWGPITVNSTPGNTLYSNGILKIGVQENGKQEVGCPASATSIVCTPTPAVPLFTPLTTTINTGQTVTYTISNAASGTFYAVADSSTGQSLGLGKWASSNGSLDITTSPFTTAGTYKVVFRATSLSGVTVCSNTSATGIITVNNISLPINLLYFKGKKENGNILLDWATASEVDVSRFEIEQSHTGSGFIKIGEVAATGFSTTIRNYGFTDNQVTGYINYYRLKMIDRDGKFIYSNVLAFSGTTDNIHLIHIRPNPFINSFTVSAEVSQPQLLTIHVSDMTGKILYTNHLPATAGKNDIKVDGIAHLAAGMYIIKLISTEGILQEKILKVK